MEAIKLNENYTITSDSNNWVLNYEMQYTNDEGKKVTSRDTWYYSKLSDLLSRFLDLRLKESDLANWMYNAISNIEQEIKTALLKHHNQ